MQADAIVKEMTGGATVMAMEQDVAALKGMKAPSGKPHPIDRTRGCTTWTFTVQDGGKPYNVLIACGGLQEDARLVNNKNYPEIAEHFGQSIQKYKTLQADVFLAAHSWFFDLAGKYKRLGTAGTNPYIDPAGYKAWVANMEKNYNTLLAEQKKNPPTN
jgi:metallo-beta-lactamase class B